MEDQMKLPEEIKTKWIAALRSGDYTQARHELNSGDGFCCLGVLAEVLEPGVTKTGDLSDCSSFRGSDEMNGGIRAFAQRHELGALFAPNDGLRAVTQEHGVEMGAWREADRALMSLNDNDWSFEDIANLIEEHL